MSGTDVGSDAAPGYSAERLGRGWALGPSRCATRCPVLGERIMMMWCATRLFSTPVAYAGIFAG